MAAPYDENQALLDGYKTTNEALGNSVTNALQIDLTTFGEVTHLDVTAMRYITVIIMEQMPDLVRENITPACKASLLRVVGSLIRTIRDINPNLNDITATLQASIDCTSDTGNPRVTRMLHNIEEFSRVYAAVRRNNRGPTMEIIRSIIRAPFTHKMDFLGNKSPACVGLLIVVLLSLCSNIMMFVKVSNSVDGMDFDNPRFMDYSRVVLDKNFNTTQLIPHILEVHRAFTNGKGDVIPYAYIGPNMNDVPVKNIEVATAETIAANPQPYYMHTTMIEFAATQAIVGKTLQLYDHTLTAITYRDYSNLVGESVVKLFASHLTSTAGVRLTNVIQSKLRANECDQETANTLLHMLNMFQTLSVDDFKQSLATLMNPSNYNPQRPYPIIGYKYSSEVPLASTMILKSVSECKTDDFANALGYLRNIFIQETESNIHEVRENIVFLDIKNNNDLPRVLLEKYGNDRTYMEMIGDNFRYVGQVMSWWESYQRERVDRTDSSIGTIERYWRTRMKPGRAALATEAVRILTGSAGLIATAYGFPLSASIVGLTTAGSMLV